MRIINYSFIEYFGKLNPESIGRPAEESPFATICADLTFAKQWSGAKDDDALIEFFKLFELTDCVKFEDVSDSSRFVKDALSEGKIAYINMPRSGCYEGHFIPENRPDGSVNAIVRSEELDALEEDAKRQINNVLFDEDEAPDTNEEADSVIHAKYPLLSYPEILDAISDFVDEFESNKDCNTAENDTWRICVENVLCTLSYAKNAKVKAQAKKIHEKYGWPMRVYYNGRNGILLDESTDENGALVAVYCFQNFPSGEYIPVEVLKKAEASTEAGDPSAEDQIHTLHRLYGWPIKIHARGYDAYLSGAQQLNDGEVEPIYHFPGGHSLVDEVEMNAVI